MLDKQKKAIAYRAYGKKLDNPVPYQFDWSEYQSNVEQKAANDMLSDDEQRKARNTLRKTKARQAALTAALSAAGIEKPTEENDEQLRLKNMVKTIMSGKKHTMEQAREIASKTLGIEWADEDEDDDE